jgi:molybdopterin-containing oxidoreductase family membrane subunit
MTCLTAIAVVGFGAFAHQVHDGMRVTALSDHVSWGLYIANFTFGVGLAAGAVMMVIPAYLYDDHEMHNLTIIGEILAIAAIALCLGFVIVDMGRPDRLWHMLPGLGRFNWPISMLTWDVIVLNGYLLINLHVTGYLLYQRYLGRKPNPKVYVPFVFLSIGWAISIHTVTAFLYSGLGGRPFWNSALLAPRFIGSAFITGPAFVIILLQVVRRVLGLSINDKPIETLRSIMKVTVPVNLFMFCSELFTAFYTGGHHSAAIQYLMFGHHGKSALVPWIWTALAFNLVSAVLVHAPLGLRGLNAACVLAFCGVWIEKGMGLIIPGFIPSTLGEFVEYVPTLTEWRITAGIWAVGLLLLTLGIKAARPVLEGELAARGADHH